MKKGFAISFKWIFSLVAGAIILIFFIRFAFLQIGTSEKFEDREILALLSDQLEGFSIADKSSREINIGKDVDIKFKCENLSISDYSKGMNKIIFSGDLSGSKLKAWTLKWMYPFRVGNFFYLSDFKTKYYFFSSLSDERYTGMASIFDKIIGTSFSLEDIKRSVGSNKAVLVFFSNPGFDRSSLSENIKAVYVDELNNRAVFYNEGKESYFFGEELMYGAIFTADYNEYDCLLRKSITKLRDLAYIYRDKAEKLQIKQNECKTIYMNIISYINGINFNALIDNIDGSEVNTLKEFNKKMEIQNRELNKYDCATLF